MLHERLKSLRKQRGLTQGELGALLGLSASAIGMYEQGRRAPDGATLAKFAEIFGVTIDSLLSPAEQGREVVEELRRTLRSKEGLMFNGEALSDEDIEQILSVIEMGTAIAMQRKRKSHNE